MHKNKILKGGQFYKELSKCGKSQIKVEVAEEIGCGNELKSLLKIGGKNEMSFN